MRHISVRILLTLALMLSMALILPSWGKGLNPVFENICVTDGLSHNTVQRIFQDSHGYIWFGTKDGLCRYDGYDYKVFRESLSLNSISNSKIRCIAEDGSGFIWAGTDNGLNKIDVVNRLIDAYFVDKEPLLKSNKINDLYCDHERHVLYVATDKGVSIFDTDRNMFLPVDENPAFCHETNVLCADQRRNCIYLGTREGLFRCPADFSGSAYLEIESGKRLNVLSLFCDSDGTLWVGNNLSMLAKLSEDTDKIELLPYGEPLSGDSFNVNSIVESDDMLWLVTKRDGIVFYDKKTGRFSRASRGMENDYAEKVMLTSGYRDSSGNIWIGTYYKGVYFHSQFMKHFHLFPVEHPRKLTTGIIGQMVPYRNGIWLGRADVGITYYEQGTEKQVFYDLSENGEPLPECKPMLMHDGLLWVGTESHGIRLFDPDAGKTVLEYSTSSKSGTIPGNRVNFAFEDSAGRIWIGVNGGPGGICLFDEDKKSFQIIRPDVPSMQVKDVYCMNEIEPGTFWIGTRNSGLYSYNIDNNIFTQIPVNGRTDLSVCCIFKDDLRRIWVGTFGQGLVRLNMDGGIERIFDMSDRRLSNNICGILQDKSGHVWISSFNGVAYFDENTDDFVEYDSDNGFPQHHIRPSSCLSASNGMMYFGGESGIVAFDPDEIMPVNHSLPKPVLTDILVRNHPVDASARYGIFHDRILDLEYYNDNITFMFAALNYVYPGKNRCRYMLEGVDTEWSAPVADRQVTYTNIGSGNYKFILTVSNGNGEWSEPVTLLNVHISRAPWNTWWAYLLYMLVGLVIIFSFIYYRLEKIKLEHSLHIKNIEKDNLNKMHRFRLDLFTNFSHEIRTPLTLVSGSVSDLIEKCPQEEKNTLGSIQRNVDKMMELLNQLMDFRKHDSGKMELRASCNDIIPFMKEMNLVFAELSKIQNRTIILDLPDGPLDLWYNPQLLEKVFYNVLINAFKYSDGESVIRMSIEKVSLQDSPYRSRTDEGIQEAAVVTISDKGNKIPESEIEEIFEPFYRLKSDEGQPGTGVGLSFNRMIMRLHHGDIWAENTADGVAFKFILPVGMEHLQENELSGEAYGKMTQGSSSLAIAEDVPEAHPSMFPERRVVLIVEDNDEIRKYLKEKMSVCFNVVDCVNGAEALEILNRIETDIVISDVMMPVMDGVELCRAIKGNPEINHIPVILLTAHVADSHVKAGLDAGADDYVLKPFKFELLLARVRNLIDNNERLRLYFQKKVNPEDMNVKVRDYDEEFLGKCYDFLCEHLQDQNLTIEDFGEALNMSRVHLYRKIKYLTNLSPSRFILNLRLKIAAEMLMSDGVTVSDVCYKVGFSNLSYFTKCFKDTYGVTPSKYSQKQ